jgi:hypothetical protein
MIANPISQTPATTTFHEISFTGKTRWRGETISIGAGVAC